MSKNWRDYACPRCNSTKLVRAYKFIEDGLEHSVRLCPQCAEDLLIDDKEAAYYDLLKKAQELDGNENREEIQTEAREK